MHDGAKLYPGTLAVLDQFASLENTRRGDDQFRQARCRECRAPDARWALRADLYVDAVSSGEVAYRLLEKSTNRRAFIIGREGDDYGFDHFELVDEPA